MDALNYVAKLNEHAQKTHAQVKYEDVAAVGPAHIRTFSMRVVINGKEYPEGVGNNKKEAKQNAAKNALRGLLESLDVTENVAEVSTASVPPPRSNYIGWLNEYCQRERVTVKYIESIDAGPSFFQSGKFLIAGKEYPTGKGKTKKEAKEEAARLAYHEICGGRTTEAGDEKTSGNPVEHGDRFREYATENNEPSRSWSVKKESESFIEENFTAMLHNYCQKTKRIIQYSEDSRCGPSHNPKFFYKLLIDGKDYPVGEGKTIKEAKQTAAKLAYSALQEQSDWDSKISPLSSAPDDATTTSTSTSASAQESSSNAIGPATSSNDFIEFKDSTDPPKGQVQSPAAKSKMVLAANFQNAIRKEDIKNLDNKKEMKDKESFSQKTKHQSVVSRFKDEYECIESIGKGAFGHVYRAKEKLLEKYYAIKIVRCKEKSLREVAALSDLLHRNIIRYYTCWMEESEYQRDSSTDCSTASQSTNNVAVKFLYIAMELCDTKTLRIWIDEKNIQNPKKSMRDSSRREASLDIAQQLISGVEYIHSHMLIHRDLKPANIMFGREQEVKIGDFGLVTVEIENDAENLLERSVYKGTPSYMAPEQRDQKIYDRKVDIFALGLIYFELLWNMFTGHERKVVWDDARKQNFPQQFVHHFSQESKIIKSMLSLMPADRPEASQLKIKLEDFAQLLQAQKSLQQERKTV